MTYNLEKTEEEPIGESVFTWYETRVIYWNKKTHTQAHDTVLSVQDHVGLINV